MQKAERVSHMPGGSQVGSQNSGQRGLNPAQEKIVTAHQEYREFIGLPSRRSTEAPLAPAPGLARKPSGRGGPAMKRAILIRRESSRIQLPEVVVTESPVVPETPIPAPGLAEKPFLRSDSLPSGSLKLALEKYGAKLRAAAEAELKAKSSKEFSRGQFLKQVEEIGAGAIDRKAAAAEFKAKHNPYTEEEKADAEADQRTKEAAETTPVVPPTDTMNPAPETERKKILHAIKLIDDVQTKLRAAQEAVARQLQLEQEEFEQPKSPTVISTSSEGKEDPSTLEPEPATGPVGTQETEKGFMKKVINWLRKKS